MVMKINERKEDNNSANDVDFVVLTGDIIQGTVPLSGVYNSHETRDSAYYTVEDEWKVAWYILQQLNVPIFMTPGNHDYYDGTLLDLGFLDNDIVDEDLTYYRKYMVPEFKSNAMNPSDGKTYWEADPDDYSFNYGDYHFIAVDSGEPLNDGFSTELNGLTSTQLDWIKADYGNYTSSLPNGTKPRAFILTHAPVYSKHSAGIRGMEDFTHKSPNDYHFVFWITKSSPQPNIEAVFCGHIHNWKFTFGLDIKPGGTTDKNIQHDDVYDYKYAYSYSYYFSNSMLQFEEG